MKKEFDVKSSDGSKVYFVSFQLDLGKLRIHCSCEAGERGMWCKHKMALAEGDLSQLKNSSQSEDVPVILEWVRGSRLAQLICEIKMAEEDMGKAKMRKSRATKQLEKAAKEGA